eukprot:TRINITY_DN13446_c0_g1_i1.p1 TRINITY_DN13446_c0_g1~~TRINITY_DN13446_c0_g1_i1.p1  ORF type:complete len:283 (+),score=87.02 TRINITY_DN13446_c0_g1_i1:69-917(+)
MGTCGSSSAGGARGPRAGVRPDGGAAGEQRPAAPASPQPAAESPPQPSGEQSAAGASAPLLPASQQLSASVTGLATTKGRSSTVAERFMSMDSFVSTMRDIAILVLQCASPGEEPGSCFYYLWHTDALLKEVRRKARARTSPARPGDLLRKAFAAFDEPPHDGVLDAEESLAFIRQYVQCYADFVTAVYAEGLGRLEVQRDASVEELKKRCSIAKAAERVTQQFKAIAPQLERDWHSRCDVNGDGRLQYQEVYQALLGDEGGEPDKLIADVIGKEFHDMVVS